MQNITAPTTTTRTIESYETGEQVTEWVTEWTVGDYTLRKTEEPGYVHWGVRTTNRDLPRVEDIAGFGQSVEFGVSCSSISDLSPEGAIAYAAQIAEAAETAKAFNEIIAAN